MARHLQVDFEPGLEYPLYDCEEAVYVGPEQLPSLSLDLLSSLRDLNTRWLRWETGGGAWPPDQDFDGDLTTARSRLVSELAGTCWKVVPGPDTAVGRFYRWRQRFTNRHR